MTGIGDAARPRTPAELDALLDGGASGDAGLDGMLSAARQPARAHELGAGPPVLPTASTADAAVRSGAPSRGPTRARRVLTRLSAATLVTKAVTAAAGAAVVGAAAVAGATGHLPGQHPHHAPAVSTSPPSASSRSGPRSGAPSSGATGSPSGSGASSGPASGSATPAPGSSAAALPALCRQWLALPPGSGATTHDPRFQVLIRVAGGVQAVTAYCRSLPSASVSAGGSSSSQVPSVSASPTTAPRHPSTSTPRGRVSSVTHAITGH